MLAVLAKTWRRALLDVSPVQRSSNEQPHGLYVHRDSVLDPVARGTPPVSPTYAFTPNKPQAYSA